MRQSMDNDDTITITLGDTSIAGRSYMDTIDTSYWTGEDTFAISDITTDTVSDSTFTIDAGTMDTVDIDWIYNSMHIDPDEVERMCKEYPALTKVWRNFKSVYDMVKQDYVGKKKAGEIDDDIPF